MGKRYAAIVSMRSKMAIRSEPWSRETGRDLVRRGVEVLATVAFLCALGLVQYRSSHECRGAEHSTPASSTIEALCRYYGSRVL